LTKFKSVIGTAALGWLLVRAFNSRNGPLNVVAALFVLNAVGYLAGGRWRATWTRREVSGFLD
jgi:hypothetical protein